MRLARRRYARVAPPCGLDLGHDRLEQQGGQLVPVRATCGKPATATGADGVARCWQHDRMARGLSGRPR